MGIWKKLLPIARLMVKSCIEERSLSLPFCAFTVLYETHNKTKSEFLP